MNKQIGALWIKSYNKDNEEKQFFSGVIDLGAMGEVNIAIFKNDNKRENKHPDYKVVLSNNSAREDTSREGVHDMKPF